MVMLGRYDLILVPDFVKIISAWVLGRRMKYNIYDDLL